MQPTAFGVRMHSGWGVLVAVSRDSNTIEIVDRRRIVVADPSIPGANQPYHYAASLAQAEPERYLTDCAAAAERLATTAFEQVVRELPGRHYRIVGSVVLLAPGRPLPSVSKILASHPLLHTAEGEFFRNAAWKACERLKIPVTAIRERELNELAKAAFGNEASRVLRRISTLGRSIGPPWTKDHKTAALAAATILAHEETD